MARGLDGLPPPPTFANEKGCEKCNYYSNPTELGYFHFSSDVANGPSSPHLLADGDNKVGGVYCNGNTLDKWCKSLEARTVIGCCFDPHPPMD